MSDIVQVLDYGHARLVEHMGSDLSIVRNARVSYNAEWRAGDDEGKDAKLIRYLWRNRHTSPFEAVQFTFDIKCPIFVARQWHRHRTFAFNEISARYAELPAEMYVPALEQITTQSKDNKQMRTAEQHPNAAWIQRIIRANCETSHDSYKQLIAAQCPRELARSVLPLAIYTHFFATVDLRNLFHFLELRLHEHAQYEIRVYAQALLELITPIVPVAISAFMEARA